MEVTELATQSRDVVKASCILQMNSMTPQNWESYTSNPRPRKKAVMHSKARKKAEVWRLKKICLGLDVWTLTGTATCAEGGDKTWPIEVELAWSPLRRLSWELFLPILAAQSGVMCQGVALYWQPFKSGARRNLILQPCTISSCSPDWWWFIVLFDLLLCPPPPSPGLSIHLPHWHHQTSLFG